MDMWNTLLMRERGVTHLLWPQGGVLWSVERVHTNMQTQQSSVTYNCPHGGEESWCMCLSVIYRLHWEDQNMHFTFKVRIVWRHRAFFCGPHFFNRLKTCCLGEMSVCKLNQSRKSASKIKDSGSTFNESQQVKLDKRSSYFCHFFHMCLRFCTK